MVGIATVLSISKNSRNGRLAPVLKEQDILNQCVEWLLLNRVPYVHHRNTGSIKTDAKGNNFFFRPKHSQKGASDLIINWHGRAVAVELKSENGHSTPDQREWLAKWKLAGGHSCICRSLDDMIRFLSGIPF